MVFHISNAARQACEECPRGQSCLQGDGGALCRIACCVDGTMHFIVCAHDGPCPYKQTVWERPLCGCPVRREIYNKYRV